MTTITNDGPVRTSDPDLKVVASRRRKGKLFIVGFRCGRLANRIILFANFIALAEEQGHRLINFTFHSYSELFVGTRRNICCRYPVPRRRSWLDVVPGVAPALRKIRILHHVTRYTSQLYERFPLFGNLVVTLRELPGHRLTFLDGPECQEKIRPAKIVFVRGWWLRAPGLVQKHGDKIRAYFRPAEPCETAVSMAIEPLRRSADVVVGVHIRHGDYRGWQGGKYFFPASRYAAWMQELAAQFPNRTVAFFVCSDEPRQAGEFPGLTVGFGAGSAVGDIYALARCDYILGTKSTFTQWASFYGEKPLLQVCDNDATARLENFRISYLDWD
jgi:hypothetical protein